METVIRTLSNLAELSSGQVALPLRDALYPEPLARIAAAAIQDVASVAFVRTAADKILVRIDVFSPHRSNSKAIIGSFLNELLRLTLKARIELPTQAER